ncbi:collagen alpha-2(I) chain-like isoform X2 [Panthera tigris]|uniref:collagen alpha-2(I) chain-like isoform X2 n=1 Tax=Panthera tigris TaxID=9694 RepID=UPI001C6F5EA0|nr:collagen alpha-2(I) chain-like isoform X2 [Panthera tigris]
MMGPSDLRAKTPKAMLEESALGSGKGQDDGHPGPPAPDERECSGPVPSAEEEGEVGRLVAGDRGAGTSLCPGASVLSRWGLQAQARLHGARGLPASTGHGKATSGPPAGQGRPPGCPAPTDHHSPVLRVLGRLRGPRGAASPGTVASEPRHMEDTSLQKSPRSRERPPENGATNKVAEGWPRLISSG